MSKPSEPGRCQSRQTQHTKKPLLILMKHVFSGNERWRIVARSVAFEVGNVYLSFPLGNPYFLPKTFRQICDIYGSLHNMSRTQLKPFYSLKQDFENRRSKDFLAGNVAV